jgi:hypothetical protein
MENSANPIKHQRSVPSGSFLILYLEERLITPVGDFRSVRKMNLLSLNLSSFNLSKRFRKERGTILLDIKKFLCVVMEYFMEMVNKEGFRMKAVIATESAYFLIKSLCQIHALYGYPADSSKTSTGKNYAV